VLIIEDMITGHVYLHITAQDGMKNDLNGAALIADDNHMIRCEHFKDNEAHRFDGPQLVIKNKDTAEVVEQQWCVNGDIRPAPGLP